MPRPLDDNPASSTDLGPALIAGFDLTTGEPVSWERARAHQPDDPPIWMHLDRKHPQTVAWIEGEANLDELVSEELLRDSTRPRIAMINGGLLMSIRGVNLNPGAEPDDMISLRIWAEPHRMITLRRSKLRAIDGIIQDFRAGGGPRTMGDLLVEIIWNLTERMGPVIEHISDVLDDYEDQVLNPDDELDRHDLIDIRQQIIALHRHLSPQTGVLQKLVTEPFDALDDRDRQELREAANRLQRHVEDLEASGRRAVVIQDELANQLAERFNQRMYLVTIIAAIFLPLTFITGMLGMNVGGVWLAQNPAGFLITTGALAALGVIGYVAMRYWHWL